MDFKTVKELQSCKGLAYGGELAHKAIRLPERDWQALKEYAQDNGTSAGEIVRVLIRDFLEQTEALRKQVRDSTTYQAVTAISWLSDYFDMSDRGLPLALSYALKKIEDDMPPEYAHIDILYTRWGAVKAYHVAVVERLHGMVKADGNFMHKYRKDY